MTRRSKGIHYSFRSLPRIVGTLAFAFGLGVVMTPQAFADHDNGRNTMKLDHPDP